MTARRTQEFVGQLDSMASLLAWVAERNPAQMPGATAHTYFALRLTGQDELAERYFEERVRPSDVFDLFDWS